MPDNLNSVGNFNGVPNLDNTTTIKSMADRLKIYTKLQNYFNVGGVAGQPMLGIAQDVNQRLLSVRMPWKFNRVFMGSKNPAENPAFLISQMGFQDIKHAGATCFVLINATTPGGQLPAGGAGVDLNPGTYRNGNAIVSYGTFNGGNAFGPTGNWQTAGIIFNPSAGTFTVQFLDPHPFQAGNIGTSTFLIQGVMNPAFNSTFDYNQLTCTSSWSNGYVCVSIPDNFHIVLQGTGGQYGTITNISATGGVTTVAVNNTMTPGDIMTFTGVTTNSALNGEIVTLTAATATTVSFATPSGVTITNGADTGTIYAANSGAPGIWNFGWMESSAVVDINNPTFPLPVSPIDAVHRISPEYVPTGDNLSMSMEKDYGNGVLLFRLSEPAQIYPFAFTCTYQARAPKFTGPESVFQWPDDLSYVLFEMCLWEGMRFAYGLSAAETQMQMQAAFQAVQAALASEDREQQELGLTPAWSIFR